MILAAGGVVNGGTIGATGSNGTLTINDTAVSNASVGKIAAETSGSTLETFNNEWSTISGAAIVNGGTVIAESANLAISGTVTNNGILEASSENALNGLAQTDGLLTISGTITGPGHAVIDGTGEIEFQGTGVRENVTFNDGASGILRLDHATSYGGEILGSLNANDKIDLIDLPYLASGSNPTKLVYSQVTNGAVTTGTLKIEDVNAQGQGPVVTIKFDGSHQLSDFTIADDGHWGNRSDRSAGQRTGQRQFGQSGAVRQLHRVDFRYAGRRARRHSGLGGCAE